MADVLAIERLINLYGHVFDDADWDRLPELFTEDATFVVARYGVSCTGLSDIERTMRSARHPLAHYASNIVVDVEDGAQRARARVKLFAPRRGNRAMIGTYRDEFARTSDGWRFSRREVCLVETAWGADQAP
jgi:3-phenylpropionate/cinnamic acid dioxygenase small subunit